METLPNECLLEIFNNLRAYHKSLFSCLLVNRFWCRIIVPILWSEPGAHFNDKRLVKICLLALNAEEQALLIPFNIILPKKQINLLFEYTKYITSVDYDYLTQGIEKYYNNSIDDRCVDYIIIRAVKCSLALMFLRSSEGLNYLNFVGNIYNEIIFIEKLRKNTSITSLRLSNSHLKDKTLDDIFNKSVNLISLKLSGNQLTPKMEEKL
ncbi:hypothetical protein F8M41_008234 [Gigaspora margarita]|uniref:F-box domain-containing protein n=1 Tax=Gigaspora margarita TaxID=4874 RepID=A0A8H4A2R3_GIGMA|nr:hypothetical protein F8M41_008234 [Gigaspora margarita]